MANTNADKAAYPAAQAVHHELRNATNSAAFLMGKLQEMKAANPKLKLLDVGCGSGTISVSFAKALPDGHVTAIDKRPVILPRAKAVAEMAGALNIDFQEADLFKLPFADRTFDVTFCHQVLTHVAKPEDALREMLRVTKSGGVVAAREGDFRSESVWPELPGLVKFHKFAADMLRAAGGTDTAGRLLLPWALKAGVKRSQVTLSFSTWSYHTESDKNTWASALIDRARGSPMRDGGLKMGLTTKSDLEEMATDWARWAANEESTLAMLHGEILIQN